MEYEVRLLAEAVEFLESLSDKLKAKAFRTIELLLGACGPRLSEPYSKKLKGYTDLNELRVK